MNHDEEKPNKSKGETALGAELEARIVAWVAGEASAFEVAELERLVREKPELGIFKRRIEAVHGLVAEAMKPETEPLRLSPERRAKLLAAIGSEASEEKENTPEAMPLPASRNRDWRRWSRWALPIAASLTLGAILAPLVFEQVSQKKRVRPDPAALKMEMVGPVEMEAKRKGSEIALREQIQSARARRDQEERAKSVAQGLSGGGRGILLRNQDLRELPKSDNYGAAVAPANPAAAGGMLNYSFDKDAAKKSADAPVQLSPFTVKAEPDVGYFAANTLAGSRLNSKLEDLGSTITVVTKQQLLDSAAVDVNDVYYYVHNTMPGRTLSEGAVKQQPEPVAVETRTATEPVSTFSLHVSDVSFRLAQAALARGELPEASRIRPEEFYNAFDYGDPAPTPAEKIGCRIEQSAHPFLQQRNLVRIAMKVPATGRGAGTPLRLTILLDTSGSMEREDRAAAVRAAMTSLVSLLGPNDRVTLIGFARTPRLLAEDVPGDRAREVLDLIARTPAEGGTNLEAAFELAGELVDRHYLTGAQNRVVLFTDGAANLGAIDPKLLAEAMDGLRARHIALDVCGVGLNGLDDEMLEALSRKSDGRYYVLNSPADADAGFAQQLAGAFRPAAENVKVQVRFNPARVASYRLIGFEQHRLREEDFRNDKVDAAELAAEEAAVALYQIEPLPQGEGELGEVFVRFRDAASGAMVERSWTMLYEPKASAFDRATSSMQLAGTAALLAEKLRGDGPQTQFKLGDLAPVVNALRGAYPNQPRVQELGTMFGQLRQLKRE